MRDDDKSDHRSRADLVSCPVHCASAGLTVGIAERALPVRRRGRIDKCSAGAQADYRVMFQAALPGDCGGQSERQQQLDGRRRLERGQPQQRDADAHEAAAVASGSGRRSTVRRGNEVDHQSEVGACHVGHLDDADAADLELAADGLRRRDAQLAAGRRDDHLVVGDEVCRRRNQGRRGHRQAAQGQIRLARARGADDQARRGRRRRWPCRACVSGRVAHWAGPPRCARPSIGRRTMKRAPHGLAPASAPSSVAVLGEDLAAMRQRRSRARC